MFSRNGLEMVTAETREPADEPLRDTLKVQPLVLTSASSVCICVLVCVSTHMHNDIMIYPRQLPNNVKQPWHNKIK